MEFQVIQGHPSMDVIYELIWTTLLHKDSTFQPCNLHLVANENMGQ